MNADKYFKFDESEEPVLDYFNATDGTHWCTVSVYGLVNTIGPYAQPLECETAVQEQIKLHLKMAKIKVEHGDLVTKLA